MKPSEPSQQQVDDFTAANDFSPVVESYELCGIAGLTGVIYELENAAYFKLSVAEIQMLPAGYPRWAR